MADVLAEFLIQLKADTSALVSGLKAAESQGGQAAENVAKRWRETGQSMQDVGKSMSKWITVPLTAIGALAVKTGMDLEQSLMNAVSVTGKTGAEAEKAYESMEKLARTLGENTVFSAKQAASAMYDLASKGFDPAQMSLQELTPYLNLAAATQSDLTSSTEIVTSAIRMFGLQNSESSRVADVYSKTIGSSAATMDKLGVSMSYVGPVAKAMGMDIEDTAAALGILYDRGYDASMAGTALRGIMMQLSEGSTDVTRELAAVGLTVEDVDIKTLGLSGALQMMVEAGMDGEAALRAFGMRAGPAAAALFDVDAAGKQTYESMSELSDALHDAGGSAQNMADIQLNTLQGSFKLLWSKIEEVCIQIAEILNPIIRELVERFIQPMIDKFSALPTPMKAVIVAFGAVAAAIGPVLLIIGKVISTLPLMISGFAATRTAMAAMTSPTTLVVAAIGGLIYAMSQLFTSSKSSIDVINEISSELKSLQDRVPQTNASIASLRSQIETLATDTTPEAVTQLMALRAELAKLVSQQEEDTAAINERREALRNELKEHQFWYDSYRSKIDLLKESKDASVAFNQEEMNSRAALEATSAAIWSSYLPAQGQAIEAVWDYYNATKQVPENHDGIGQSAYQMSADTEAAFDRMRDALREYNEMVLDAQQRMNSWLDEVSVANQVWDQMSWDSAEAMHVIVNELGITEEAFLGAMMAIDQQMTAQQGRTFQWSSDWQTLFQMLGINAQQFADAYARVWGQNVAVTEYGVGATVAGSSNMANAMASANSKMAGSASSAAASITGSWNSVISKSQSAQSILSAITGQASAAIDTLNRYYQDAQSRLAIINSLSAAARQKVIEAQNLVAATQTINATAGSTVGYYTQEEVTALNAAIKKAIESGVDSSQFKVQGFAGGGTVPGPVGMPRMAIVHGGEQVLTPAQASSNVNTSTLEVKLVNPVFLGKESDARQLVQIIKDQLRQEARLGWSLT